MLYIKIDKGYFAFNMGTLKIMLKCSEHEPSLWWAITQDQGKRLHIIQFRAAPLSPSLNVAL